MNDPLLDKLLRSKKYRDVCPDTVRRVWETSHSRHRKPKDAEKAAREALHGITGAFLTPAEAAAALSGIRRWAEGGRADADLERLLALHASTRERLPLQAMDALFERLCGPVGGTRVLDLACGIHPLYLAARGAAVVGVDISGKAVEIVNAFAEIAGVEASARCADLLCPGAIPPERFDVALLFKAVPLLERQQAGAFARIVSAVNARAVVVSFPTRTLGGKNVGMAAHYAEWMERHVSEGRVIGDRFEMGNELFYVIREES